jgi:hypothetical protein
MVAISTLIIALNRDGASNCASMFRPLAGDGSAYLDDTRSNMLVGGTYPDTRFAAAEFPALRSMGLTGIAYLGNTLQLRHLSAILSVYDVSMKTNQIKL